MAQTAAPAMIRALAPDGRSRQERVREARGSVANCLPGPHLQGRARRCPAGGSSQRIGVRTQ